MHGADNNFVEKKTRCEDYQKVAYLRTSVTSLSLLELAELT